MVTCDTSYLCALYIPQDNSTAAIDWYQQSKNAIMVPDIVLLEFKHSLRLQAWLHDQDKNKGFPEQKAQATMTEIENHLSTGTLKQIDCSWPAVLRLTERLSTRYTFSSGCRIYDLMIIAAALNIGATEFLTFDGRQRRIAEAEGLRTPLRA